MNEDFFAPQDFGDVPTAPGPEFGLIPAGTLCWTVIHVRGINQSKNGNHYLDLELTVEGGNYDRRKIWDMVGIGGSDDYVRIGRQSVKAILEANGAGPENPQGYQLPRGYPQLDGMRAAIRVKIEKGIGKYVDKNRPIYLTPNPDSNLSKEFAKLTDGTRISAPFAGGIQGTATPQQAALAPAPQQTQSGPAPQAGPINANTGVKTPGWL